MGGFGVGLWAASLRRCPLAGSPVDMVLSDGKSYKVSRRVDRKLYNFLAPCRCMHVQVCARGFVFVGAGVPASHIRMLNNGQVCLSFCVCHVRACVWGSLRVHAGEVHVPLRS